MLHTNETLLKWSSTRNGSGSDVRGDFIGITNSCWVFVIIYILHEFFFPFSIQTPSMLARTILQAWWKKDNLYIFCSLLHTASSWPPIDKSIEAGGFVGLFFFNVCTRTPLGSSWLEIGEIPTFPLYFDRRMGFPPEEFDLHLRVFLFWTPAKELRTIEQIFH